MFEASYNGFRLKVFAPVDASRLFLSDFDSNIKKARETVNPPRRFLENLRAL